MSRAPVLVVSFSIACALLMGSMPIGESASSQDLAQVGAGDDGSDLARMSKSNGTLVQRETHNLTKVETSYGNDIECRVLVIKSLIATGIQGESKPVGGMVFSVEEKYGSKSLYVDQDEIEGILAAMLFLEQKGLGVINGSILKLGSDGGKSTEIHFATRDGQRTTSTSKTTGTPSLTHSPQ